LSPFPPGSGHLGLRVSAQDGPTGLVLRLTGDLDSISAPDLIGLSAPLIGLSPGDVRLDLSGVDFLDAAGMRSLLSLHTLVRARAGRLALAGVPPFVRRILDAEGLSDLVEEETTHLVGNTRSATDPP
jgi:anti-anti-sigma factor